MPNNKKNWKVWLLPLAALLLTLIWGLFTRYMVGMDDSMSFDYKTIDYVPGKSPHSAVSQE